MKKFAQNLRNNRVFFLFTLLVGLCFSGVSVASPSISGEMVEAFVSGSNRAVSLLLLFIGANLLQAVLSQLDMVLTEKLSLRLKRDFRRRAFSGFLRREASDQKDRAAFQSFLNNDVPVLVEKTFTGSIDIVKCLGLLLMSAASLVGIHWLMALVILGTSLLMAVVIPRVMGERDAAARKAYSESLARYNTLLGSLLDGLQVVRAYRYAPRAEELLEEKNQSVAQRETVLLRRRLMVYGSTAWLQIVKTLLIFLLGLFLIRRGELTAGGLITVVQLAALIASPMEVLAYLLHARNEARPLLQSYESYADAPSPPPGKPAGRFSHLKAQGLGTGNLNILQDLNLEIRAGEKLLITGESGSGKSTLLRLLGRTGLGEPSGEFSGTITYNGTDIRSLDPDSYHAAVCPVFQEPHLFHLSLEENILLGRDIPEEACRELISRLNLSYLLERKTEGDPKFMEKLSGGERQRIALARAMAGRPQLYLLDEVTSALDRKNARLIEELLLEERAAVIHVCHKPDRELAERYDRRYRMQDGRLILI